MISRGTLENQASLRENGPVTEGQLCLDGLSAARLLWLQADACQDAGQARHFLADMEVVVPWEPLIRLIKPSGPKISKKGACSPCLLALMLWIHLWH